VKKSSHGARELKEMGGRYGKKSGIPLALNRGAAEEEVGFAEWR